MPALSQDSFFFLGSVGEKISHSGPIICAYIHQDGVAYCHIITYASPGVRATPPLLSPPTACFTWLPWHWTWLKNGRGEAGRAQAIPSDLCGTAHRENRLAWFLKNRSGNRVCLHTICCLSYLVCPCREIFDAASSPLFIQRDRIQHQIWSRNLNQPAPIWNGEGVFRNLLCNPGDKWGFIYVLKYRMKLWTPG